jgi:hypothetical protein
MKWRAIRRTGGLQWVVKKALMQWLGFWQPFTPRRNSEPQEMGRTGGARRARGRENGKAFDKNEKGKVENKKYKMYALRPTLTANRSEHGHRGGAEWGNHERHERSVEVLFRSA